MAKQEKQAKQIKKAKEGKIKNFLNANKKLSILIFIAAFLFLVFISFRVWLGFHFLIIDDLVLNLEPQDKSLYIHYSEKPNITFSAEIENSFFCDASCSYEFEDLSEESIIGNGAFSTKGVEKNFKKSFQLSASRVGSGQKIYVFNIECNNIRKGYCKTNENIRKRSSFVTLNYGLSDYEKFLKSTLRENITKLSEKLLDIDIKMQELNDMSSKLGLYANLKELESDREILNRNYNDIVTEFKSLEKLWSEQNYLLLSEILNNTYNSRVLAIGQKIAEINSGISGIVDRHNSIAEGLNLFDNSLRSMDRILVFLNRADELLINSHKRLLSRISQSKLLIQPNNFENYTFFDKELLEINSSMENFVNESGSKFMHVYLGGLYYSNLEKSILCGIKGNCMSKSDFLAGLTDSLSVEDAEIGNLCASFGVIKEAYSMENNKSRELMKGYPDEVNSIIENAKSKKILIAKKNISNGISSIVPGNNTAAPLNILLDLGRVIQNFSEEIDYGNFRENEILSLVQLNLSNASSAYYSNYCSPNQLNLSGHYGSIILLEQLNLSNFKKGNFSPRIGITLAEDSPLCCVFRICKRCCERDQCSKDPALYPVLFLHGHAFNSGNSPEFSLDAFNKIQAKLQEDGYISAGTITPVSDYSGIMEGEWGLQSRPISVKGSYYRISYYNLSGYSLATQKSENIETYAIRLKELIGLLKFRTGKDKVIIISHSMGSLVARSYMQIFGDSSVYKLIMLDSPNKGISGQVSGYCPILGEKKECNDMSENSIFIKNLNDPLKIPKNAKLYNIIGIGCDIDGKTGDGIVTKENAELSYAKNYYINGTCSTTKPLHTAMLDINDYPEVYRTLRSILRN